MTTQLLLIDDSQTIQKVVNLAFQNSHMTVRYVSSLIEALSEGEQLIPDIVVADASLPGSRAPQIYSDLRKKWNHIPFVVLIGSYDTIDRESFVRCGIDCFLQKPFDAGELTSIVKKQLMQSGTKLNAEKSIFSDDSSFSKQEPLTQLRSDNELNTGSGKSDFQNSIAHQMKDDISYSLRSDAEEDVLEFSPPPPPPEEVFQKHVKNSDVKKARLDLFGEDNGFELPTENSRTEIGGNQRIKYEKKSDSEAARFEEWGQESLEEGLVAPFLREELVGIVRQTVLDYCERHFSRLAREIITEEIKNLTDSKTRLLIDN
jgi:DNA-binding response OmpR family regulator